MNQVFGGLTKKYSLPSLPNLPTFKFNQLSGVGDSVWLRVSIALDSTQVQFPAPVAGAYDCLKIQLLGGIQDPLPVPLVISAHVQIPPPHTHTYA